MYEEYDIQELKDLIDEKLERIDEFDRMDKEQCIPFNTPADHMVQFCTLNKSLKNELIREVLEINNLITQKQNLSKQK